MNILVHDEATVELTNTADEYERCQPGLGDEFFREYDHAVAGIGRNPDGHPLLETAPASWGVRRSLLHRFPYAVIFEFKLQQVRVLAIAHTARRPNYWNRRLRSP